MPEPDDPNQAPAGDGDLELRAATQCEETPAQKEAPMEIHPIHGPVLTLREFFVHLTIITLGILIALSLESLLEWRHHRSLVREARENLTREIARNKKLIDDNLAAIRLGEKQLNQIIETMERFERNRNLHGHWDLTYGFTFKSPHSTNWDTANRSGAINYMSYSEVEQYTEIYDQQQELVGLSHQALAPLAQLGFMNVVFHKDLKNLPNQDLEEIERIANEALVIEQALEGAAQELHDDYEKFHGSPQ
jgi:hypothetical protein